MSVGTQNPDNRAELKTVDARSLAFPDHFGLLAEGWYHDHGTARVAFTSARDAASKAHGNPYRRVKRLSSPK